MAILDDLYRHLGGALDAEASLDAEDDQALEEIDKRERELQEQRAGAEGDPRALQAIDSELRELDEAFKTITERRADADQPEDPDALPGRGDDGDGVDRVAGS